MKAKKLAAVALSLCLTVLSFMKDAKKFMEENEKQRKK